MSYLLPVDKVTAVKQGNTGEIGVTYLIIKVLREHFPDCINIFRISAHMSL